MILKNSNVERVLLAQGKQANKQRLFTCEGISVDEFIRYKDDLQLMPINLQMKYQTELLTCVLLKNFNTKFINYPEIVILQNFRGTVLDITDRGLKQLHILNCNIQKVQFLQEPDILSVSNSSIEQISHFPTQQFHIFSSYFHQVLNLASTIIKLTIFDVQLKYQQQLNLIDFDNLLELSLKLSQKLTVRQNLCLKQLEIIKLEDFDYLPFKLDQFRSIQTLSIINCQFDIEDVLSYSVNSIQKLTLKKYEFNHVDLREFKSLNYLSLDHLKQLFLPKTLQILDIQHTSEPYKIQNSIKQITAKSCSNILLHHQLTKIDISNTNSAISDFSQFIYLKDLNTSNNQLLTSLLLPLGIAKIQAENCNFHSINLEKLLKLKFVDLSSNKLDSVLLPRNIISVILKKFQGDYIDFTRCIFIQNLILDFSQIKYIFFQKQVFLSCEGCQRLSCVQVKGYGQDQKGIQAIRKEIPTLLLRNLTLERQFLMLMKKKIQDVSRQVIQIMAEVNYCE